jgi:hypothetical protein
MDDPVVSGARLVVHIGGCQCESNAFVVHFGFDENREIQGFVLHLLYYLVVSVPS